MNTKTIARHYAHLKPEERFRLVVAASDRGDEAERDRIALSGQRLTLSTPDHTPWSHAFEELSNVVLLEIIEEAAKHHDAFERWSDAVDLRSIEVGAEADEGHVEDDDGDSICTRHLELYFAQGFILKTKIDGWKLFCERMGISPFATWQYMPGFDRLQRVLELLEGAEDRAPPAFRPEGMLQWLIRKRPPGASKPTMDTLVSAERFAADLDRTFRERVRWWGG